MGTLQTLLEQQLAELPRPIATEIVKGKLAEVGKADDDELLKEVVEQLLGNRDLDDDEDDPEQEESDTAGSSDGDAEELVLTFTEEDAKRIGDFSNRFSNELPSLITQLAGTEATEGKIKREEAAKRRDGSRRQSETQSHRCVRSCPCEPDRLSDASDRRRPLLSAREAPRDAAPSHALDQWPHLRRSHPQAFRHDYAIEPSHAILMAGL
jgi:hypothetical protein